MYFLPETLTHGLKECAPATQNDIGKQVLSYIIFAFHDRVEAVLVNSFKVMTSHLRVKQNLGASEALISNLYFPTVWQFVVLLIFVGLL